MFNIKGLEGRHVKGYVENMVININKTFPPPIMFEYEKTLWCILNFVKKKYAYIFMDKWGNPVIHYEKEDPNYYILPDCESKYAGKRIDFLNTVYNFFYFFNTLFFLIF